MNRLDEEPGLARLRDQAALALVAAHAARGGLFKRLRTLPPATADRVAAALGWELGPTRAILQALAACGLVRRDPDLSTWSLGSRGLEAAAGDLGALLDLAGALAPASGGRRAPPPDRAPLGVLAERILPGEPGLREALERGAQVVGLAGSDETLAWLAARFPRARVERLDPTAALPAADLVLHLSPLAVPDHPERWLAEAARALAPGGRLVLRALRRPLAAAATGRGWWHALGVAAALGGSGAPWSVPFARRALLRAGYPPPAAHSSPDDPDCDHLVVRAGSAPASARPR